VERLVSDMLSNPVRISVGQTGTANEDVTQRVEVVEGGELAKRAWLMRQLQVCICVREWVSGFVNTCQ